MDGSVQIPFEIHSCENQVYDDIFPVPLNQVLNSHSVVLHRLVQVLAKDGLLSS